MIPITKIGSFLPQDENDFIINDLSINNIEQEWQTVIQIIVNAYQKHLQEKLHSIYLRGTVARGIATKGFSDIDTFALVHTHENIRWQQAHFQATTEQVIQQQFNFVKGVEINISSYHKDFYNKNPRLAMIIKTQSLCIFGKNIAPLLPDFRPNHEMCLNIQWIEKDIISILQKIKNGTNTLDDCQSIMKVILRTGFELVIEREKRYTPDLYLCYFTFSKYYPNYEKQMKQALIWYLNPITAPNELYTYLTIFCSFLVKEIQKLNPKLLC